MNEQESLEEKRLSYDVFYTTQKLSPSTSISVGCPNGKKKK
jgi:hypothetical protein